MDYNRNDSSTACSIMRWFKFSHRLTRLLNHLKFVQLSDNKGSFYKVYFIAGNLAVIPFMITLAFISIITDTRLLLYYSAGLSLFYTINLLILKYLKMPQNLLLIQKTVTLIVTLVMVYEFGGMLQSGGIILIAIAPVMHSIIFRQKKWIVMEFGLFTTGIILLYLLPNPNASSPILSDKLNNLIFTFAMLGVTGYIFLFALYALSLFRQMEKNETIRQIEMSEAKSRLFTNVTHEFRTPISVILGLTEALRDGKVKDLNMTFNTISRNASNLLKLVEQLMRISKLENNKMEIRNIHGDIIPFINYLFQLDEPLAEKKHIKYQIHCNQNAIILDYDPDIIGSIITNLLSNSLKFTPDKGNIDLTLSLENNLLKISVTDNGIGILEEDIPKIFDRFYTADDKTTRQYSSTGLGLSITKEMVELLGGSIQVSSVPNEKTTFAVTIPAINLNHVTNTCDETDKFINIYEDSNRTDSDEINENDTGSQKHLLLIEDNQDIVDFLRLYYEEQFTIHWAENGKHGYEMAINKIPDIIVSDIMMPEMDGLELCRLLKKDFRTSHIPIILLTAKSDQPSRIEGLRQGADAYIVKPFDQNELNIRIEKLLDLRKTLQKKYSKGLLPDTSDYPKDCEGQFLRKLNAIIVQNLEDETFDVERLCLEIGMSKSQLYRKYKALTNDSIARSIRQLRLEKARILLEHSNLSITEIGEKVGIKSPSTFSKIFKEEYGESPNSYSSHQMTKRYQTAKSE